MQDGASRAGGFAGVSGDRVPLRMLAALLFALYAYCFQGGGWNQNSRFDTVRALVEQGRFEITEFASNTGDVSVYQGRVYSNKTPGTLQHAPPSRRPRAPRRPRSSSATSRILRHRPVSSWWAIMY